MGDIKTRDLGVPLQDHFQGTFIDARSCLQIVTGPYPPPKHADFETSAVLR